MRIALVCAGLSLCLLSGCMDYDAARGRAVISAKEKCESEGKQFQLVSTEDDTVHKAVVLTGHCLGPGDPGYVTPPKAQ